MSLEQALAANTAALQALTAALGAVPQSVAPVQPAPFIAAVAPVPTAPVELPASSPLPTAAFAPPVPTVPSAAPTVAPPTAPPAASGSVERDSKGMPYDGRIHSASKNKVADGSWRYKRGVDEAVVIAVEAELRTAASAAPVGGVGTPWPFPAEGAAPVPQVPVAAAAPVVVPVQPAVAPPPVVTPPPAASVAVPVAPVAGMTYEQLMAALPPKIVSGELTAQQLQQACEQFGVPSIAALATRPDLVPAVAAILGLR